MKSENKLKTCNIINYTGIIIAIAVVIVYLKANATCHPVSAPPPSVYWSRRTYRHNASESEKFIPKTLWMSECATIVRLSNITSAIIYCSKYLNDTVWAEVNVPGFKPLSLPPGNYLVAQKGDGLLHRNLSGHEAQVIYRYWDVKTLHEWSELQHKWKIVTTPNPYIERKELKTFDPFEPQDFLSTMVSPIMPVMMLFRQIHRASCISTIDYLQPLPSLVVGMKFKDRSHDDQVMIHSPGYYDVSFNPREQSNPPVVKPWTRDIFEEMRRKVADQGKEELEKFEQQVERIRQQGVPPPL